MATDIDSPINTTSGRDFGLLVLRLAVGATLLQAGLIKLLDLSTTIAFMESSGWRSPTVAAVMVSVSETAGGIGLLLGLLTPLSALAVVAAMIDAWAFTASTAAFWSDPFNVPFLTGLGAVALLFTGAGVHSLDERLWARASWPRLISIIALVLAIAAAVTTWVVLNGTNPIHLTTPSG